MKNIFLILFFLTIGLSTRFAQEYYQIKSLKVSKSCKSSDSSFQGQINCQMIKNSFSHDHSSWPIYSELSSDRGHTEGLFFPTIVIGQYGTSSKELISSTLHHEIDIHANQNLFMITTLDFFLKTNLALYAEREAYISEINHAKQHNLSKREIKDIEDTLDSEYAYQNPSYFESFLLPYVLADENSDLIYLKSH